MKVKLVSADMWSPTLEYTVEHLPVVIGRNGKSDLAIRDRWSSDRHCELRDVHGELMVRDLRSAHGTLLNGEAIRQATVQPGDILTIGIRSFRVSYRRSKRALDDKSQDAPASDRRARQTITATEE